MNNSTTHNTDTEETWFLNRRVRIIQPVKGYRAAVDSVFVAAAVAGRPGLKVLDAGAGSGAISLCLAARLSDVRVTGLELQDEMAGLFEKSVAINGFENIDIVRGDLMAATKQLQPNSYDVVVTNPPYTATGPVSPHTSKAVAHIESHVGLQDWLLCCLAMLKHKGQLLLVHRADRVHEICAALAGKAGDIRIFPLWSKTGQPAKRVVVQAKKGVKTPATLLPGLVVHERNGDYTPDAYRILFNAEPLEME